MNSCSMLEYQIIGTSVNHDVMLEEVKCYNNLLVRLNAVADPGGGGTGLTKVDDRSQTYLKTVSKTFNVEP